MERFSVFVDDVRENSRLIRKQLFSDADLSMECYSALMIFRAAALK